MKKTKEKTIWCLRHADAEHNFFFREGRKKKNDEILNKGKHLPDPSLTKHGIEQLKNVIISKDINPQVILFSPLSRTIQTTMIVFKEQWKNRKKNNIKFVPMADIQERNAGKYLCDTGVSVTELEKKFPNFVKFSDFLNENWHKEVEFSKKKERYQRALKTINNMKEDRIFIVAHNGTLLNLLPFMDDSNKFKNAELRKYQFKDGKFIDPKKQKK